MCYVICICLHQYSFGFVQLFRGGFFKGFLFEPIFMWQPISLCMYFFFLHPSLSVLLTQAYWLIIFCQLKKKIELYFIFYYINNLYKLIQSTCYDKHDKCL